MKMVHLWARRRNRAELSISTIEEEAVAFFKKHLDAVEISLEQAQALEIAAGMEVRDPIDGLPVWG